MKEFTVVIDGEERTIKGPSKATQEEAQAEAERQHAGADHPVHAIERLEAKPKPKAKTKPKAKRR